MAAPSAPPRRDRKTYVEKRTFSIDVGHKAVRSWGRGPAHVFFGFARGDLQAANRCSGAEIRATRRREPCAMVSRVSVWVGATFGSGGRPYVSDVAKMDGIKYVDSRRPSRGDYLFGS